MQKKIVLVDDNKEILETLSLLLEYEGYQTFLACSGEELLKKLSDNRPDLILLDYSLPGENGGEIAGRLRKNIIFKHIPIILISAHENIKELARALSVDSYIAKPFLMEDLLQKVKLYIA